MSAVLCSLNHACKCLWKEISVFNRTVGTEHFWCMSLIWYSGCCLSVVFLSSQAALQKQQQQADSMMRGTIESSNFNSGDVIPASAAGPLRSASPPAGEEVPTLNGGQSDTYSESMDREPEPEPAEEVSENGPLLGWWALASCLSHYIHTYWSSPYLDRIHIFPFYAASGHKAEGEPLCQTN